MDKTKIELEEAKKQWGIALSKTLELVADFVIEEGNPDIRKVNYYGEICFYYDHITSTEDFYSFSFKGIDVNLLADKIVKIECRPADWGSDLVKWVVKLREEFSEWVAEKVEREHFETKEAEATGN